jgi:nucleoside 2-deoxyribosyltransferase
MTKVYLAGPDVFLPDVAAWLARKKAICAACQLTGICPLDDLTRGVVRLPRMAPHRPPP